MPAHHTAENESLFLQLPTPRAQEPGSTSPGYGDSLNDVANRWVNGHAPKDIADDSILRTPSVVDSTGGAISEKQARERGRMVKVADQAAQLAFENGLKVSDAVADSLLPTPTLGHLRNHDEPVDDYLQRRQDFVNGRTKGMPGASLGVAVRMNWGKFEPAIRRWEALTRPAPAPTNPDGKDNNHRLSSKFTEWMMGLPDGWVTGHGLKRNDELKMCGNGVVPQQAELALRLLLGQADIPKELS